MSIPKEQQQKVNVQAIIRAKTNHYKDSKERYSLAYFETKSEKLKELWSKVEDLHAEVFNSKSNNPETQAAYFEEYAQAESVAEELLIRYRTYIDHYVKSAKETAKKSEIQQNITTSHTSSNGIKLERVKIPTFSGDYLQWVTYHDIFSSLVDQNEELQPVLKMQHLVSSLGGDAKKLVAHLPISEANYEIAWDTIKRRFDNKRVILKTYLRTFMDIPRIAEEKANSYKHMLDTTNEVLAGIGNLGISTSSWDPLIIFLLYGKLDLKAQKDWELHLGESLDFPTLKKFLGYLEVKFRALEAAISAPSTQNVQKSKINVHMAQQQHCPICERAHVIYRCHDFKNYSVEQRRKIVKEKGLCFNCLKNDHSVPQCTNKARCRNCGKAHHTWLHTQDVSSENKGTKIVSNSATLSTNVSKPTIQNVISSNIATDHHETEVLLATAVAPFKASNGEYVTYRILIDPGSQCSFVTERAVSNLRLRRQKCNQSVQGVDCSRVAKTKGRVNLSMKFKFTQGELEFDAIILRKITNTLPTRPIEKQDIGILEQDLADPSYFMPGKIDILLGSDVYGSILLNGIISGKVVAQYTKLGWTLSGPTTAKSTKKSTISMVCFQNLEEDLKRFWEIEEVDYTPPLTQDEQMAEDHFSLTTTRHATGAYIVSLPFNPKYDLSIHLDCGRDSALKRFYSVERKLKQNPEFAEMYRKFMQEYKDLGHMVRVPQEEISNRNCHYLPQHAVLKTDSLTTKLRVVCDPTQKGKTGLSLNDVLLTGPAIQNNSFDVFLRWRTHKYVVGSDVEKMFRSILMDSQDCHYQRVVDRDLETGAIQDWMLTTVTYGMTCAPFQAMRVLQQIATDVAREFPEESRIIAQDFYVDDLLTGGNDITEVQRIAKNISRILAGYNMKLRKWVSNSREILESIPKSDQIEHLCLDLLPSEEVKMLGIQWIPQDDIFTFKINIQSTNHQGKISKRLLLSEVAKLYDPLGWIQPVVILGKILIQRLCLLKYSWDEDIPHDIASKWLEIKEQFSYLESIKIQRWLHTTEGHNIQLHGFCDASSAAYAAVVYVRVQYPNGTVTTNIVTSKSKVAPIKMISIPRLELCGAVLLIDLMRKVTNGIRLSNARIFYWTDSQIVLSWIQAHASRWKVFVGNRVSKIQQHSSGNQWNHVSTGDNPADAASRGLKPKEVLESKLWWSGPAWLLQAPSRWPNITTSEETNSEEEERKSHTFVATLSSGDPTESFVDHYSSFSKMIRHMAIWMRFIHNAQVGIKNNGCKKTGFITAEEKRAATIRCIQLSQQKSFPIELNLLNSNKQLSKGNILLPLSPFIDSEGILRVGGRLRKANISNSQKHPAILRKTHLANVIIDYYHKMSLHGGTQLVISLIRQKFWIIGCTSAVRSHTRNCVTCFKTNARVNEQIMGELPHYRVNPSRPFLHSGLDFAGPLTIRWSTGRGAKTIKVYIALFVCLATKALHLEMVEDLTADACIAALQRFCGRRGIPSTIHSDNGTNFVGANKKLKKEFQLMVKNSTYFIHSKEIEWKFISPGSPHIGGLWEAGVKAVKRHLVKVVPDTSVLTHVELNTLLIQIEACVNSRPLCAISNDPNDFEILTPSHFLTGDQLLALPESSVSETNISLLKRWNKVQAVKQHFWRLWQKDYLQQLQTRTKWQKERENLKVDDLVLVKHENTPSNKWPMARVKEVHPGEDGKVRVVSLLMPGKEHKIIRRPITKLAKLPEDDVPSNDNVDNAANYTSTKRCSTFLSRLFYMMFIITSLFSCSHATLNISKVEGGLFVEHLGRIYKGQGSLQLVLQVKHSEILSDRNKVNDMVSKLHELCRDLKAVPELNDCEDLHSHIQEYALEIQHTMDILKMSNPRLKRGLLGKLLTNIFGVNDEVIHDVNSLTDNQNTLRHTIDNQGKLMLKMVRTLNETNASISKKMLRFTQFLDVSSQHFNEINEIYSEVALNKIQLKYLGAFERANSFLREVHAKYHSLADIVTSGSSILNCLSLKEVHSIIHNATALLPNNTRIIQVPVARTLIKHLSNKLVISGNLPMVSTAEFELIKVTAIPHKVAKNRYVMYDISTDLLAVNYDLQLYFELSEAMLQQSPRIEENIFLVDVSLIKHFQANPNCVLKEVYGIHLGNSCALKPYFITNPVWKKLITHNAWMCIAPFATPVHTVCQGHREERLLQEVNIINISSECILRTENFTLTPEYDTFSYGATIYIKPIRPELNFSLEYGAYSPINVTEVVQANQDFSQFITEQIQINTERQAIDWKEVGTHSLSSGIVLTIGALVLLCYYGIRKHRNKKKDDHFQRMTWWGSLRTRKTGEEGENPQQTATWWGGPVQDTSV